MGDVDRTCTGSTCWIWPKQTHIAFTSTPQGDVWGLGLMKRCSLPCTVQLSFTGSGSTSATQILVSDMETHSWYQLSGPSMLLAVVHMRFGPVTTSHISMLTIATLCSVLLNTLCGQSGTLKWNVKSLRGKDHPPFLKVPRNLIVNAGFLYVREHFPE